MSPRSSPGARRLRSFSRSLPMALMQAREAVMARFRPLLRAHGITEQQWRVLRALVSTSEASATEIAERTCLSMPSLSRILRSLEQRNLVGRRLRPTDLRGAWIVITARGRALVDRVGEESEARYAEIEAAFGKARLARLHRELASLSASLGSWWEGRDPPTSP